MKRRVSLIIAIAVCFAMFFSVNAFAAASDDAVPYEFGHTYTGTIGDSFGQTKSFSFTVSEKSNVYFNITNESGMGMFTIALVGANGKDYLDTDDFSAKYNSAKEITTRTVSRVIPKGTYYLILKKYNVNVEYTVFATAEPAVSLARPTITKLKNSASKKMTVKISSVKGSTGYQIKYALNERFTKAKTVTGSVSKTIKKLKKGKTYYVKVRAYTIYGSGNKAYSAWSTVKTVKIKK